MKTEGQFRSELLERSKPTLHSIAVANRAVESFGLKSDLSEFGNHLKTTRCQLTDSSGIVAQGLGKGIGNQSRASGIFEALEHLLSEKDWASSRQDFLKLDLSSYDSELSNASPDFGLIVGNSNVLLARTPYHSLNDFDTVLRYPVFLGNPNYISALEEERAFLDDFGLMRYSTNSGIASGLETFDSILHGLLEIIERDSLGVEFIRTVFSKTPKPVRNIIPGSMPAHLRYLYKEIENETDGEVTLWECTSDLCVPAFLARLSVPGYSEGTYFGSGASLFPAYAVERALLETMQSFHAHSFNKMPLPIEGKKDLTRMPSYTRCFLDAGIFGFRGGEVLKSFSDVADPIKTMSIRRAENQVIFLSRVLESNGISSYWRFLHSETIKVTHVIAPKLERFHLLSHGIAVMPCARGRSFLA